MMTSINKIDFNVEILSENAEKIQIKLGGPGITREVVNSLRRVCLTDIPIMCAEEAQIYLNTSKMDDEMLVQRLGLVVFDSTYAYKFVYAGECKCSQYRLSEFCEICGVKFTLKIKNYDKKENRFVTSSDLIPDSPYTTVLPVHHRRNILKNKNKNQSQINKDSNNNNNNNNDDDDDEYDDSIILTLLQPGEEIDMSFIVRKGTQRKNNHNKFTPVAEVGIKNPGIIRIDNDKIQKLTIEQKLEIVKESPEQLFNYDPIKDCLSTIDDPNNSLACKFFHDVPSLVAKYGQPNAIEIFDRTDYFIITFFTLGSISPRAIFREALIQLINNFKEIYYSLPIARSFFS
jgi:DNA-directed RNA polymerase subunit D